MIAPGVARPPRRDYLSLMRTSLPLAALLLLCACASEEPAPAHSINPTLPWAAGMCTIWIASPLKEKSRRRPRYASVGNAEAVRRVRASKPAQAELVRADEVEAA